MSRLGIMRKTLRDWRTASIAVGLVLVVVGVFTILIYPEYRDTIEDADFGGIFEGFIGDAGSLSSPEGFISAEFFSWVPLLLITVAVIAATGATAGEEVAGTMDLLLAQPVRRRTVVLQKAAGIGIAMTFAALAGVPGLFLGRALVDEFDVSWWRLFAATLNMLPVTFVFLALGMWAGASMPSRAAASMLVIGAVVAAYFLNAIGAAVDALETVRKLSPFYWADGSHVLVHGPTLGRPLGLLLVAGVFLALAVWSFERRDISAGRKEWSWRSLIPRRG